MGVHEFDFPIAPSHLFDIQDVLALFLILRMVVVISISSIAALR